MIYDIIIIGAGPSGMMAAYSASKTNPEKNILLIEKNNELGKKLLLTGGSRCNITNQKPIKEQIKLYPKKNFIKHSLYKLDNEKLLEIFKNEDIEFKIEDNGRIFPKTNQSQTIRNTLENLIKNKITISKNTKVTNIKKDNEYFTIETNKEILKSQKVILTTGGITYPKTGSTGDGYHYSEKLNHINTPIKPGLVSLKVNDTKLHKISGTNLDNIKVSYKNSEKKKYTTTGSVLITHKGLSGPSIINLSNYIMENQDYDLLNNKRIFKEVLISLDLQAQLDNEELKRKIEEDKKEYSKTKLKNYLKQYMPYKFIKYFLDRLNINPDTSLNQLGKKDKNKLIENLKNLEFKITGIIEEDSKISIGGVSTEEINGKTLESKITKGLYFAGEILEFAGPTGGYNLQLAFSTGYLAGYSASI